MSISNGTKASSVRERIVDAKDFGQTPDYILISGSTTVISTDGSQDTPVPYNKYIAKDIITAINDAEGTVSYAQDAGYAQNAGTARTATYAQNADYANEASLTRQIKVEDVTQGTTTDYANYKIQIVTSPPSSGATPNIIYMVVE